MKLRDAELSDGEIPEGYLQQEIITSCRICKSTPQPLIGPHGPGPRRGAYRFEPEIEAGEKAEMQGAQMPLMMITMMSNKDSATMTGLHLSLHVFEELACKSC